MSTESGDNKLIGNFRKLITEVSADAASASPQPSLYADLNNAAFVLVVGDPCYRIRPPKNVISH